MNLDWFTNFVCYTFLMLTPLPEAIHCRPQVSGRFTIDITINIDFFGCMIKQKIMCGYVSSCSQRTPTSAHITSNIWSMLKYDLGRFLWRRVFFEVQSHAKVWDVFRVKVSYFGDNFYVRYSHGQTLNQKVAYLGVSYFRKRLYL